MITARQPGQSETPEQRRAKVETLLRESASWEPDAPPTDFVAAAMEKQRDKNRKRLWSFLPARMTWWGIGTVGTAGVAAASLLFSFTGRMPLLESKDPSPNPVAVSTSEPVAVQQARSVETATQAQSSAKGTTGTKVVNRAVPGASTSVRSHNSGVRFSAHRMSGYSSARRRFASSSRSVRRMASANLGSSAPRNEIQKPGTTGASEQIPNNTLAAIPTSEVYTTDDGRMLVPVVLTHTNEDGTEISYTPAVVEMAYQPVGNAL